MIGNKSIFSTWGTGATLDTTAPVYRQTSIFSQERGQFPQDTEMNSLVPTGYEFYNLLYQIKVLLFVLVIIKIICMIRK